MENYTTLFTFSENSDDISDFSLVADESTLNMNTLSLTGGSPSLKDDVSHSNASASVRARNCSGASVAASVSTVKTIDLEQGTSILTKAYSRGFMAHNYVDRESVPKVHVSGVEISTVAISTYEAKQLETYYVKRVVSPFEFYLEREIETKDEESQRHQKMQKAYEDEEKKAYEYFIKVSKMTCYAYHDRNSKTWWRVRVLDFETEAEDGINRAYIYYCDTGKQESILCEDLRNLHESFRGAWGTVVLKCYLYDVLPISGDMHWSVRSMIFFNEWMTNQRLGAIVMKWTRQSVVEYSPDYTFDCGVVLIEKVDPSETPETINRRMVDFGYARSTGLMSCSAKTLEIPAFVPHFKGTEAPKTTTNQPNFEPISYADLHRIVSERMSESELKPTNRPYAYYLDEKPRPKKASVQTKLPKEIKSSLAVVRMSFVEGPDKFFVHTTIKKLQLKAMEKEIREGLKGSLPKPSVQELKPGSVILCSMTNRVKPKFKDCCRAFVLEVNVTRNAARVILVDYGNILWVSHVVMFELPIKYHSIPSFVHRVHLCDIRPSYKGLKWDQPIRTFFFKYVMSYEKQQPAYLVHIADKEDAVQFVDLDQRVVFNEKESKWVAGNPSQSGDEDAFVTSMRNDPLLASHFYSHAVDIMYEKRVAETEFWGFEHLSDFLVKRRHAILVKPRIDKRKIHKIIKDGFGFL